MIFRWSKLIKNLQEAMEIQKQLSTDFKLIPEVLIRKKKKYKAE